MLFLDVINFLNRIYIFIGLIFLISFSIHTRVNAANDETSIKGPAFEAILLKNPNSPRSSNRFSCLEPIFLKITWHKIYGKHEASVIWFNSIGEKQEATESHFQGKNDIEKSWFALEFTNVFEKENFAKPREAGRQFTGTWMVKVFLDGKILDTQSFFVDCG